MSSSTSNPTLSNSSPATSVAHDSSSYYGTSPEANYWQIRENGSRYRIQSPSGNLLEAENVENGLSNNFSLTGTIESSSDTSYEEHACLDVVRTKTPAFPAQSNPLPLRQKGDSVEDGAASVSDSRAHRGELEGAPLSTSDMPWYAMDGISSKELIAFFPNHVGKWPAAAARLIEDGYSTKEIADNINRSRVIEGQKAPVLANTLGVSINKACRQFYSQPDFKAQDHRSVISSRTPFAIEAIKQLVASKKWLPTSIARHPVTLTPAWSLTQIAHHYTSNRKPFPCDGLFTQRLVCELKGTRTALEGLNPPTLPPNWAPANIAERGSKGKSKRVFSDLADGEATVSKRTKVAEAPNTTGSDRLISRGKRLVPADLPGDFLENITSYSHILVGEVLLHVISKIGGRMTMASLCEQLVANPTTKSVDASTLRHRKKTALKERAAANKTTYKEESDSFNINEAFKPGDIDDQPRQKASSKSTVPTRVQPRRATRSAVAFHDEEEDDDESACSEALLPALPATSYPGLDSQPEQVPTFSYNGQIMEEVEPLSTPDMHASILAFIAQNPEPGTSTAPATYSGAGLGLALGPEQSHVYTHSQSYEDVFGRAGSSVSALSSKQAQVSATGSTMVFGDTMMSDFTPQLPIDLRTFPDQTQAPGSNTFHSGFTDEFKANNGVFSPLPPTQSNDSEFHSGFTPLPGHSGFTPLPGEEAATFEDYQELPSSSIFTFHTGNTPELRANNAIFEAMLLDTPNREGVYHSMPTAAANNPSPQTFFYGMDYSSPKVAVAIAEDNDISMSDDNDEGSLHDHVLEELEKSVFDRYVNTFDEE